jgi:hypothetical protein
MQRSPGLSSNLAFRLPRADGDYVLLAYPKAAAKRGAFVGFRPLGRPCDGMQVKMVMPMLEAGYAGNLLFSPISLLPEANQT